MEPSRPAKAHDRQHRRTRHRTAAVTGVLVATGLALPAPPAGAKPGPGIEALRQRADQLNTQLEQLTEQYDGLRVRLQQAQRAATIAEATSRRETAALRGI